MKKVKKLASEIHLNDVIVNVAGNHTYIVTNINRFGGNLSFTLLDEHNHYFEHDTSDDHPLQRYEVLIED